MDNTQIKVDEPRMDECEAYRVVLLDGESFKGKGETGVRIVRLGGPEYTKRRESEPGKVSAPQTPRLTAASQKSEKNQMQERGVRVIDLKKASDKEAEKRKKQRISDSKVKEEKRLRRDLGNSIGEGSFTNASSSLVNSYSTPFALALNASNAEIGLLTSVQSMAGILSQLPGARLTRSMTRKKIWFICTLLSRLFLIPLVIIGMFISPGSLAVWLLIIFLGVSSFFNTMRGPAWSSMMGDIVPTGRRGKYFGNRNMIIGTAGMIATLSAGAAVYYWGFPLIFAAAIALSFLSIIFFLRIREPELKQERAYHYRMHFHPGDLIYQIRTNRNFAIFTAYITFVNIGVNIAAPFIAVYMLKDLSIGYGWFAVIVTMGALAHILSQRYWGARCDRYGNRKMMVVAGVLMSFIPLGYMFSTNVLHLMIVKIFDGFIWGAFDLVVFSYLLGVTPSEKRPGFVANHNFMAGSGIVIGALLGALLAQSLQSSTFLIFYGLQIVFLVSFILRLSSAVFLRGISEVEVKEDTVPVRYLFWESVAVGPAKGVEHAVMSAFRYPYSVKIKSKLGLNSKKKIKISTEKFESVTHEKKIFDHIGVLPVRKQTRGGTAPGNAKTRAASSGSNTESKDSEVLEMALGNRQKSGTDEYMELGLERQVPKSAKIVVHHLQRFSETDKVVKSIRAKNVVFVGLKTMKQTNMDELKQAVAKINRVCSETGSSLNLVEEEWLIVTPQSAAIV
jgi:MFS family permease/SepF-like predicted cell division protein (DUF552 family)